MKILHLADTHIGPFPGPMVDGKNARAEDTLRCFDELIDKAATLRPDLIVHAGDLFHAAKTWSERGIGEVNDAIRRIERLVEIAPVVIVRGTPNHDGVQHYQMLRTHFDDNLFVTIITDPGVYHVLGLNDTAASICALPGFDKGYWRAQNPGLDREQETQAFSDALEKMVIGMRAQCGTSYPAVLVGHYTVEGANTESGQTMMFSQFEPIITHRALTAANYDLCCFGHIHKPQELGANAFYSGSINRLNFNDEGDKRGFYLHTLEGNELVNSEFIELESPRRFVTLHMGDDDIADFNAVGQLHYDKRDVDGAIVRVLYSCTDEHHKALDRAAMEHALTDCGAFWVQEITPIDIRATIDRTELTAENDPLHNLKDYLAGKVAQGMIAQGDAEDAAEKGQAIISRVLADSRENKASGLFVPVEISVTNYRNYRSETFSFDDVRFATINGQNGAGKSSLFMDALYDALFEEPREGDLTGWISNDPAVRSGAIVFTFRVGNAMWRVSRTRVKSGKATLNLAEMVDGEWADRSCEKLRDTQEAIERVIGMNGQTLRACALIMQDQYGLFLQAGKEERMQILSDILGLGVYDLMAGEAAEGTTDANRDVRILQARRADLEQQRGDVDALTIRREAASADAAECDKVIASLNEELNDLNERLSKLNTTADVYALYRMQISELRGDIAKAEEQKAAAERDRDSFAAMLAKQSEIMDGAERYRIAAEQRDALQDRVAEFAVLSEKKHSIEAAIRSAEASQGQNMTRLHELKTRSEKLKAAIARKDEFEHKQAEHSRIEAEIEEAEAENVRWRDMDAVANLAKMKLADMKNNARADWRERAAGIEDAKKRIAMLENSNCPIVENATCRFLADAIAARDTLPELEKAHAEATETARVQIAAQEDAVRAAETVRNAVRRVDDQTLTQMRGRLRELASASVMLAQIAGYEDELKLVEASAAEVEARDDTLTYEIEMKRSELAKAENDLVEYTEAYECYQAVLKDIAAYRSCAEQEQQLIGAKDRMNAAQERVNTFDQQIITCMEHIRDREKLLENDAATETERHGVKSSIELAKAKIDTENARRDQIVGTLARIATEIERAEELTRQINSIAAEIAGKAHTAAMYELLKEAFGPSGVPHNILRSIIPIFEATASNILGQMTGGMMSVELVTEKTLKSNSKKEVTTLDVIVNDAETGRLPYLSRSGGERVKASLSVILALSEIMKSKLGVQIGFIFLDESPFLDSNGVQAYCDALETIQRRYPDMKVMAITHDDTFKARFPQSITVTKDELGSHASMD